ncbi:MAG TPA: hypothetical protein VGO52_03980, partial [Hyphomonadaceae bacterium]|nr:hypothetical protein [Hyphomonadaceae bacterium]
MYDPGPDTRDDPWSEYRKRREEWRASRCERRAAWREMRQARRAAWRARWYGGDWAGNWGGDVGAAPASDTGAKTKIADMQATIDRLLERVAVLEKLATD